MNFSNDVVNELKKIVHESEPLGPVDISDITSKEIQHVLFESQNKIYEGITKHPSIVVGRRGSGKTTFLNSLVHEADRNTLVVEIPGSQAFERIVAALTSASGSTHVFPESIAELWDWVFWVSLYEKAKITYPDHTSATISKAKRTTGFLSKIVPLFDGSRFEAVKVLKNVLAAREEFSKENLEKVKQDTRNILDSADAQALILFDSLENYRLEQLRMDDAIAGLLKAAGRFNQVRDGIEIRLCLPSELYHEFRKLSSHSIKDFRHQLILHWHAGELLSLAAHRYKIYLNLYPEQIAIGELRFLNSLDIHSRNDTMLFWKRILPDTITNAVGIKEDPIAYLLRHTQLLPRQMILLLNTIMRIHFRNKGSAANISENAIINGVETAEKEIWEEVCNAYQSIYPDAHSVVKAIVGELDLVFDHATLQSAYVKHVKRALKDHIEMDFHEFKRMAVEIGLIGAVLGKTHRYVEGVFEYTQGEELSIASHTEMCLHPLYCGSQSKLAYCETKVVIYPYGTDPLGDDTRDF